MKVNENGKYIDHAEYYYNPYIDRWCVSGTTICMESLMEIEELWEDKSELHEIEAPEYVSEDYEGSEW